MELFYFQQFINKVTKIYQLNSDGKINKILLEKEVGLIASFIYVSEDSFIALTFTSGILHLNSDGSFKELVKPEAGYFSGIKLNNGKIWAGHINGSIWELHNN